MAKLTSKERSKIPTSKFAGPDRSYPIEDKAHARNAKARAAQFASPALKARIDAKADKVLGKSGAGKGMEHYAKGGTGPKGTSGGMARAKEMKGSRFDRMSKESSKYMTGKRG